MNDKWPCRASDLLTYCASGPSTFSPAYALRHDHEVELHASWYVCTAKQQHLRTSLPYSECTPGYEEILTYLNSYLCVPYRSRPRRRQRLFNEGSSNPRCENGGNKVDTARTGRGATEGSGEGWSGWDRCQYRQSEKKRKPGREEERDGELISWWKWYGQAQ